MRGIELRPDGPHSDAYTCKVAGAFAESVKVLNHAVLDLGQAGLTAPATAYTLTGELSAGIYGLRQLADLVSAYLRYQQSAGRLASDHGPNAVAGEVSAARARLVDAATAATALSAALSAAQCALSGLYLKDES